MGFIINLSKPKLRALHGGSRRVQVQFNVHMDMYQLASHALRSNGLNGLASDALLLSTCMRIN
jgi:hypothetical protein